MHAGTDSAPPAAADAAPPSRVATCSYAYMPAVSAAGAEVGIIWGVLPAAAGEAPWKG
jgi:hypothetical protein